MHSNFGLVLHITLVLYYNLILVENLKLLTISTIFRNIMKIGFYTKNPRQDRNMCSLLISLIGMNPQQVVISKSCYFSHPHFHFLHITIHKTIRIIIAPGNKRNNNIHSKMENKAAAYLLTLCFDTHKSIHNTATIQHI